MIRHRIDAGDGIYLDVSLDVPPTPEDQEALKALARAAATLDEQASKCHEVVACPKCFAPIGERCVRALRQHIRRGVFANGQPQLKHPHRERWTQVVPPR